MSTTTSGGRSQLPLHRQGAGKKRLFRQQGSEAQQQQDGLRCGEVSDILNAFADRLVGLGVYEYAPAGSKNAFMERLVRFGLAL